MADSVDALRVGGALTGNGSGRSARFAGVAEEDGAFARWERAEIGVGGFQDSVPAVRLEDDARVEIGAVVNERRAVAANSCMGTSPHGALPFAAAS
jgi:hypothetical protein